MKVVNQSNVVSRSVVQVFLPRAAGALEILGDDTVVIFRLLVVSESIVILMYM